MVHVKSFMKQYWIFVLLLLGMFSFVVYKVLKRKPRSETDAANKVLKKFGGGFTEQKKIDLNHLTVSLAQNLGTSFSKWDPRYYTENDKVVFELLDPLTQKEFDLVASLYFGVYAKGNDLRVDLAKMLDSKYYEQLKIK